MVDGDSRLGALRRIVLPLVTGIGARHVFCLIVSWNEFLFALVLTQTDDAMTLPVGIAGRVSIGIKWDVMSAAVRLVAMICRSRVRDERAEVSGERVVAGREVKPAG